MARPDNMVHGSEAAKAAAEEAAKAEKPTLDTSNEGVLSALEEAGFDDALVSDVEGREVCPNDALQSVGTYVSFHVLHAALMFRLIDR